MKVQILSIRNQKRNTTINEIDLKKILRDYEQYYASTFQMLYEVDKFLEKHMLSSDMRRNRKFECKSHN